MTDERIKEIADHYGLDSQLSMMQEECAELIQAISKYRRTGDVQGVYEELADVHIMFDQLIYLLEEKTGDDVISILSIEKAKKIQRQLGRMLKHE